MSAPASPSSPPADIDGLLRGVVEPLAALVRRAGSPEEERAAALIVEAFQRVGAGARIDAVSFRDGYAALLLPFAFAGFPDLIQRTDTGVPFWWTAAAGPAFAALGAATGSRLLARAGAALSALNLAFGADIARNRIVPGASDNLSGVAALVALAQRLGVQPPAGIRVLLASCGAEEVLQGGIYPFVEGRLKPLDPERTWVLNLDTLGSPELLMLEGEGPFRMHDYTDAAFRDLIAEVAESTTGAPLRRGARARASTDAIVPSRAGYPTATLVSWEPDTKLQSHYHLPTDVPEHVRYDTVARAVAIAEGLARALAVRRPPG